MNKMNKFLLSTFLAFLFSCGTTAQISGYSSKNKKAIALFEEAQKAPTKNLSVSKPTPDYKAGIEYCDKALEKDPNFWEAHSLAADFAEYSEQYELAIFHLKESLRINPANSPSGSVHYILANLQMKVSDYEAAAKSYETYIAVKNANPQLVADAKKQIESCNFAAEAKKNPTEFTPINLGPGVNTKDREYFPTITVDGKTILFTRRIEDKRIGGPIPEQEDFYVSQLSNSKSWATATPMPLNINTIRNEGAPTISADGKSLIFVACSMGDALDYGENRTGKGTCDLFVTKRLGQQWTNPVNLPGKVNSSAWESQPSLSADGKTLYFVRGVRGRSLQNDDDIYYSNLQDDGTWGQAIRLSNTINTDQTEESVLIHPDGKTLYFSSRGHKGFGGLDIFISRLDEKGNWGTPENLGYPINSADDENSLMVSADGEIAFFASDRPGGFGKLDIYYFVMPGKHRPIKTLYFDGLVFDETTKKPVPGKFSLIDLATGKEVIRSEADGINGSFTVSLPINKEYALSVSYPGYNNYSVNFNMTVAENQTEVHKDIPLVPITSVTVNPLKNVFFDLTKATLREASYIELNKLRDWLKANPTLKIELNGHTDTRGDAAENLKLSNDRAKAVMDYLIAQGVDSKRLTAKGYGETKTIISDEMIAKLNTEGEKEKAHQENRRTEYIIVK